MTKFTKEELELIYEAVYELRDTYLDAADLENPIISDKLQMMHDLLNKVNNGMRE